MTTICYTKGVMVSDTRAYSGQRTPIGVKTKIFRLSDGGLYGCSCPSPGFGEALFAWLEGGKIEANTPKAPEHGFTALIVDKKGKVFYAKDNFYFSGPIKVKYAAIGSGEEFAMGAFEMGADARQACAVATRLDPFSAPPYLTLRLDDVSK